MQLIASPGVRRRALSRLVASSLLVVLAGAASLARADEASGTWTGALSARGNYYWERSTRVVEPTAGLEVDAPNGLRMHAEYGADVITSASVASGLIADIRFTEVRHDVSVGVGYTAALADTAELDVDAHGRLSTEPDYDSRGGGVTATLSLDDHATVLRLDANVLDDDVYKILRGAQRAAAGRDLSNRGQVGNLDVLSLGLTWQQTLSPVLTTELGYDFGGLWGFQANAYRMVSVQGVNQPETHPETRYRHALHGGLAYYVRPSHTAIHARYRAYLDSWDIAALTPELLVYQELGDDVVLRARYRYYAQTAAYFYAIPASYTPEDAYFTQDPKMAEFHSHTLGLSALVRLDFLEGTALDFAHAFELDVAFDYIWCTSRFGDGVVAQVGLRAPF